MVYTLGVPKPTGAGFAVISCYLQILLSLDHLHHSGSLDKVSPHFLLSPHIPLPLIWCPFRHRHRTPVVLLTYNLLPVYILTSCCEYPHWSSPLPLTAPCTCNAPFYRVLPNSEFILMYPRQGP